MMRTGTSWSDIAEAFLWVGGCCGDESVAHLSYALDGGGELVAWADQAFRVAGPADPARGAGEYDVAGKQLQDVGERGDELADGEHELSGSGLLHLLAVQAAADRQVIGVGEFFRGDQARPERSEAGVGLAEVVLLRSGRAQLRFP